MNVHNVQICSVAYTGVYRNGGYIMRIGIRAHDVAYAPLRYLWYGMTYIETGIIYLIPLSYLLSKVLKIKIKKKGN